MPGLGISGRHTHLAATKSNAVPLTDQAPVSNSQEWDGCDDGQDGCLRNSDRSRIKPPGLESTQEPRESMRILTTLLQAEDMASLTALPWFFVVSLSLWNFRIRSNSTSHVAHGLARNNCRFVGHGNSVKPTCKIASLGAFEEALNAPLFPVKDLATIFLFFSILLLFVLYMPNA